MNMSKWLGSLAALAAIVASASDVSAQRPGGGPGGGRPSFDRLLQVFDANGDDALDASEVPDRVWSRLSRADANGDGTVTRQEFASF